MINVPYGTYVFSTKLILKLFQTICSTFKIQYEISKKYVQNKHHDEEKQLQFKTLDITTPIMFTEIQNTHSVHL